MALLCRRLWLFVVAAVMACGTAQARRPSIVVMLSDDQRWDSLGVVQRELGPGGRFAWMRSATPNLDRIAAEGVRFRNAFAVSSLWSPSRAAFLTGRYNHLNGVANNHSPLPPESATYATLLRDAGYRTGYFGKWHMGVQRERPGFDRYASFVGQSSYESVSFLVDGVARPTVGWVDDISTSFAIDFIRANADLPFVAVLGFKAPHSPYTPPERLAARFASAVARPAASATSYAPYDPSPVPGIDASETIRNYFRTIVGVDQNVGRVLDALAQAGIANDTVVVFASDNGLFLGEHGIGPGFGGQDGNKRNAYEESIRIPLLLRYPRQPRRGIAPGAIALNIDLAPTLLELAEVARPTSIQGNSWVPLISGQVAPPRPQFLYEYFFETGYEVPTLLALRRGKYKLVRYPGHAAWNELFNLAEDGNERRNLIDEAASQATLQTMNLQLDSEIAATGYIVPPYATPRPPDSRSSRHTQLAAVRSSLTSCASLVTSTAPGIRVLPTTKLGVPLMPSFSARAWFSSSRVLIQSCSISAAISSLL
jgi:N-acetylglucosamine-6-sulfatase